MHSQKNLNNKVPLGSDLPVFENGKHIRLGIMGGTFNPIHFGHLVCAEQVKEDLGLDHVLFLPAGNPAFKQHQNVVCADDRFEMVELAVRDNPHFSASRFEIDYEGITYTVETLTRLRDFYDTNVEFYFITGADAILNIISWKNADQLAQLTHFVGATRPGYNLDKVVDLIFSSDIDFDVVYTEVPSLAISSSYLRQRYEEGKSVHYLLPEEVDSYIKDHNLYKKETYV